MGVRAGREHQAIGGRATPGKAAGGAREAPADRAGSSQAPPVGVCSRQGEGLCGEGSGWAVASLECFAKEPVGLEKG